MNSEEGDKNDSGKRMATTEATDIKPNRYEMYGNSEADNKLANFKTSSQTNAFRSLLRRGNQEKGVTLHIKEPTIPSKDCGNLNPVSTTQRPKSALSDPSNLCSLFGVSLNQPLKYSRNALTVKDVMNERRPKSSCSYLTPREIPRVSKH